MIKKIVIPAAGLGTRLLPITKEIPKEMMPLFLQDKEGEMSVKPLIQIIYEKFFHFGLREYCIIVGRQKRIIEDHGGKIKIEKNKNMAGTISTITFTVQNA